MCRQADTLPSWLSFTVLLDESAAALEQQLYSVLGRGDNTSIALLTLDSGYIPGVAKQLANFGSM